MVLELILVVTVMLVKLDRVRRYLHKALKYHTQPSTSLPFDTLELCL